nr:isoform 2 of probable 3-hydroxyisobutyrate dehydrogenase-like 1, mitochondrial [Quercus suber]
MDSSRGVESIGRTDGRATESNEVQETAAATARVKDPSNSQRAQNGRHGCGGNVIEVQEKISEDNAAPLLNVEKVMPSFTQGGNAEPNLNNESTVVHTTSSTLGHVESKPNKPKATWTRLNRMEVGPPNSVSSVLKPTLGKRNKGDTLDEDFNRETEHTVCSVLLDPTSGVLSGLRHDGILVDMTTSEPSLAAGIFVAASSKDYFFINALVSGGDLRAKSGRLAIFVGGDESVVKHFESTFCPPW